MSIIKLLHRFFRNEAPLGPPGENITPEWLTRPYFHSLMEDTLARNSALAVIERQAMERTYLQTGLELAAVRTARVEYARMAATAPSAPIGTTARALTDAHIRAAYAQIVAPMGVEYRTTWTTDTTSTSTTGWNTYDTPAGIGLTPNTITLHQMAAMGYDWDGVAHNWVPTPKSRSHPRVLNDINI